MGGLVRLCSASNKESVRNATPSSKYRTFLTHTPGRQAIQTCLFVHQFIVVGKEGSELGWSVGQNFEDIGQKASLQ